MSASNGTRNHLSGGDIKTNAVLDARALNRALLARQMLLRREKLSVLEAVERLIGLQAQAPNAPYFALWARLEDFRQEGLSRLLLDKQAVRMALMRATLHLVSASDAMQLRSTLQSVMERSLKGAFGRQLKGADPKQLAAFGRSLVEDRPRTFGELGRHMRERWPALQGEALAAAVRNLVPLVQLPPRGIWGESGQAVHTSAERWLGQSRSAEPDTELLIRRYLAAFGPATAKDVQAWSGLTGLGKAMERLRPGLVAFRNPAGEELFDLPDAPRPDSDTPAEPRFLGEFDNTLLSHADRGRILPDEYRSQVCTANGIVRSTILIDGYVAGTWKLTRERGKAILCIDPFVALSSPDSDALRLEGARLLQFAAEDHSHEVIIQQGGS
ncbi:Winged helix DNA-binding domain-containing protein [Paenibacillus sp. UNC496MF]|uniref:winged helix DNA-binding domain-containing protein n=1 Tax=Paenibacillus sp. UNC496MF TaxID=1502753 RepID=UPI0008E81E97|nr:winged helix DNA-binding domain-containing protein [Paenibacillus sp. UNC496MF]SFJ16340.1 Winged helix DNA-binding domain-containing protein [Paenibacillus sp. UNC496MF]